MKIFISNSKEDKNYADAISSRLKLEGHELCVDSQKIRAGDNIITKITEGIKEADAFIIIISESSLQSQWSMREFSAIAVGEISKKKTRIIPVLVDDSIIPQYLAQYSHIILKKIEYLFIWDDVPGKDSKRLVDYLVNDLKINWAKEEDIKKSDDGKTITITKDNNSLELKLNEEENRVILKTSTGETYEYRLEKEKDDIKNIYKFDIKEGINKIATLLRKSTDSGFSINEQKKSYDDAINSLKKSLYDGRLTLVCGAGVSIDAGIPAWNDLLITLLGRMMTKMSKDRNILIKNTNPNEFTKRYAINAIILGKYLKTYLGDDFLKEVRDCLYSNNPKTCAIIDSIVELSRPQRTSKPLDSIITFNFDSLLEENFKKEGIKHKAIYSEAEGIDYSPGELPLFHVHGYLPREGNISVDNEIVFSEDTYHSQFIDSFSWPNLIQLNKLYQNNCLLIGVSLTDPNLRRLLDVSKRKNPNRAHKHYILKKIPKFSGKNDSIAKLALILEEQDANEFGLNVIWISDYSEIPEILKNIIT